MPGAPTRPRILRPKPGSLKPKPVSLKPKRGSLKLKRGLIKRKVSLNEAQAKVINKVKKNKVAVKDVRNINSKSVNYLVNHAEKSPNPRANLIKMGINAEQLKSRGYQVKKIIKLFGVEDAVRLYGNKGVVREYEIQDITEYQSRGIDIKNRKIKGLEKFALMYGEDHVARSLGGYKRIVADFGLEDAYRAFGIITIDKAYGGRRNIIKTLGEEKVNRAIQAIMGK